MLVYLTCKSVIIELTLCEDKGEEQSFGLLNPSELCQSRTEASKTFEIKSFINLSCGKLKGLRHFVFTFASFLFLKFSPN